MRLQNIRTRRHTLNWTLNTAVNNSQWQTETHRSRREKRDNFAIISKWIKSFSLASISISIWFNCNAGIQCLCGSAVCVLFLVRFFFWRGHIFAHHLCGTFKVMLLNKDFFFSVLLFKKKSKRARPNYYDSRFLGWLYFSCSRTKGRLPADIPAKMSNKIFGPYFHELHKDFHSACFANNKKSNIIASHSFCSHRWSGGGRETEKQKHAFPFPFFCVILFNDCVFFFFYFTWMPFLVRFNHSSEKSAQVLQVVKDRWTLDRQIEWRTRAYEAFFSVFRRSLHSQTDDMTEYEAKALQTKQNEDKCWACISGGVCLVSVRFCSPLERERPK